MTESVVEPRKRNAASPRPRSVVQNYGTPLEFFIPVEKRFGSMRWDLAAEEGNRKCVNWIGEDRDSLKVEWHKLGANLWLNPPFADIRPWAEKCYYESLLGAMVFMLVPNSTGSTWCRDFVWGKAKVHFLIGRIQFEGAAWIYPKDCMLVEYQPPWIWPPTRWSELWDWRSGAVY